MTEATASYIAPCTIPASTVLLAGVRNPGAAGGGGGVGLAEIAASATALQCTTALSFGADDAEAPAVDDDPGACTADDDAEAPPTRPATTSVAAAAVRSLMSHPSLSQGSASPVGEAIAIRAWLRPGMRETRKPQVFAAYRLASSARERMPSLR
jgi:hypothetical protein